MSPRRLEQAEHRQVEPIFLSSNIEYVSMRGRGMFIIDKTRMVKMGKQLTLVFEKLFAKSPAIVSKFDLASLGGLVDSDDQLGPFDKGRIEINLLRLHQKLEDVALDFSKRLNNVRGEGYQWLAEDQPE